MHQLPALLTALIASAPLSAQQSFHNYESAPVHPIRVSADGTRLFAVNTPDNRLEVYSLADPARPVLIRDIPVGLEPVSVMPRTNDEVWVVNNLSDSVSVVSVGKGHVVATLRVVDEPADVVFAAGKAFVSAAATDELHVFDASTRAALGTIPIFGKDPRALAVSADGMSVYVLVHRSGNGTTAIPASLAPPPPLPSNPMLPPAPHEGLIVRADDPAWSSAINFTLPDNDVVEIDAASQQVVRSFNTLGTILFDLAVHPVTGDLYVAGTDARNLMRFEPQVQSHTIESRVARVTTGPQPAVSFFDLNPGFTYANFPNLSERALALAEPTGLALDGEAGRLFVAAQGTDRIAVLDLAGTILRRIEVGQATGAQLDTLHKRGPRALALHPSAPRLYVKNHLAPTICVIDTELMRVISEKPQAFDPMPPNVRAGRRFQFEAKLSGNGTASCNSCHIDGDIDGLVWDLGDPAGTLTPPPHQPPPFNVGLVQYHPMKGPLATQTLRGLRGVGPYHWRGEKPDLFSFNAGFAGVLGGSLLAPSELQLYVAFLESIEFPPNPNQNLDRTLKNTPASANPVQGAVFFSGQGGSPSCLLCHAIPSGTDGIVHSGSGLGEPQQQKTPHLRNMYRKAGGSSSGPSKTGFGFHHDGVRITLTDFFNTPAFFIWPRAFKPHIIAFVLSFDTGTAPAVGYQVTVDSSNAVSAAVASDVTLLESQAALANCELVVKGTLDGIEHGLHYDPSAGTYTGDATGLGPLAWSELRDQALAARAVWTFTGTPPGSGPRIGIDRDLDGQPDGADGIEYVSAPVPGCAERPHVFVNSKPRIGNAGFALVCSGLAPGRTGTLVLERAGLPFSGSFRPFLSAARSAPFGGAPVSADADGFAWIERPIPDDPSLIGRSFLGLGIFSDSCAPGGSMLSEALIVTIRP